VIQIESKIGKLLLRALHHTTNVARCHLDLVNLSLSLTTFLSFFRMKSHPHHPLWKHMVIRKKSSHPTISLVFGEAQQVSPSHTAAEKLPQILRKASPSPSSLMSKVQLEEYLDETPSSTPNQSELANAHEAGEELTTGAQESLQFVAEGIAF
jgi:hypothetical protein